MTDGSDSKVIKNANSRLAVLFPRLVIEELPIRRDKSNNSERHPASAQISHLERPDRRIDHVYDVLLTRVGASTLKVAVHDYNLRPTTIA